MAKNNVKKESRRKFIGDLSKASLATGMMATTTKNSGNELKKAFIHHVFFWLKNSDSTEDKAKLIQGLRKLSKVKASYQTDPIHLKFVDECAQLWGRVVVHDTVDAIV